MQNRWSGRTVSIGAGSISAVRRAKLRGQRHRAIRAGDGAPRRDIRSSPPHIGGMPHLDLTDEEEAVLTVELVQLISRAKYPFSDRVRTLGAILNKLRPEQCAGRRRCMPRRERASGVGAEW